MKRREFIARANEAGGFNAAAISVGRKLHLLNASTEPELQAAFTNVVQLQAGGLVIGTDAFFNTQTARLARLSLRHAVPVVFQFREFAAAGGLMSYGDSLTDRSRQVGVYAGRILKGEKPADLYRSSSRPKPN